ncbi:hypothetical protein PHYPSEUDO_014308 [Phytophthora pseudosyringae]|uniref:Uncharacterized protein n=1 Tax=Phytophthora pseudosyringae TaxID=221518 RepID=A0A8T1WI13_9STRA|nr:hypothetical protein PHYPSEUDO_014308 [Phytophthora pseudosyringae]
MAASSQGDDDDEERRALERELAAELAALSAQDVGFDEDLGGDVDQNDAIAGSNGESETAYVRLDLDKVLKQVSEGSADEVQDLLGHASGSSSSREEHQVPPITSWELLLRSVERSDREFFQPCHENLQEIRTSILHGQQVTGEGEEQPHQWEDQVVPPTLELATSQPEETALLTSVHESEQQANSLGKVEKSKQKCEKIATANVSTVATDNLLEQAVASEAAGLARVNPARPAPNAPEPPTQTLPLPDVRLPTIIPDENQSEDDRAMRKELQVITKQQEARALRRLKVQAAYEKERDEAAQLLVRLQVEFDAQEKNSEITRQEARERTLMAKEEIRCRQVAAAKLEANEMALMTLADEVSQKFAAELARIQNAISKETAQMEAEDQAERHRVQVERQTRHKKQQNLAWCQFGEVLRELAKYHEIQRQNRDQQTQRERRECVHMRAEEVSMRRVMAESRALCEQQERERNRALMRFEEKLASAREDLKWSRKLQAEERFREDSCRGFMEDEEGRARSAWAFAHKLQLVQMQNEERSRLAMSQEEERCQRAWMYLAGLAEAETKERERQRQAQRLRTRSNVSAGLQGLGGVFRQHQMVLCLAKWRRWHEESIGEDRIRSETADNAAKRIQLWHRSCRERLQQLDSVEPPLILEDFSDDEEQPQVEEDSEDDGDMEELAVGVDVNSSESQEAALRLQSTFRGFHVRRKFANALALAVAVGEHEEADSFDAVDLDDLIQLPPELVDGWEDPMLPLAQRQYPPMPQRDHREEESFSHLENIEMVALEEEDQSVEHAKSVVKAKSPPVAKNPPKEQTLAASLWNKMKRVKQRQQQTQQERQRQQDPAYRVQKLLNRKPNNCSDSNQNGNSSNNQSSLSRLQTPQRGQKAPSTVSWSSTSTAKKKPKVKLPSLVERLRKQTMAER